MSIRECDERAEYVKGKAANFGFVTTYAILIAEMAVELWKPGILEWNGLPIGYFVAAMAGALAYLFYLISHRTFGSGMMKVMAISCVIGGLCGFAITALHLFGN